MNYSKNDPVIIEAIKHDIEANGIEIKDIVKKYGISEYYARKYTGELYKAMSDDTYVRRRFKWIVISYREHIEALISKAIPLNEAMEISETTWNKIDKILKDELYNMCKEIIKKN